MRLTLKLFAAAAVVAGLSACPGPTPGTDAGTDGGTDGGFVQPAGTVAVNFTIDDSANKVFGPGELKWKGSFKYDAGTRVIEKSNWDGPHPTLFDDGPWNAGGHEPANATAGDKKWGITVFVKPPATGSDTFNYGAEDVTTNGWIWPGATDGAFTVAAGATAPINADGFALKAFGTTDLKLVINTNALATRPTLPDGGTAGWDTTKIAVKGSAWSWQEVELKDDGVAPDDTASDGNYTFILSGVVGAGKLLPHSGLLSTNDKPEFNFVLNGAEYKATSGAGLDTGVTAFTKAAGGSFVAATIALNAKNNTYVTIP